MVTEQQLARLVDAFYAKVRADAVLGPLFNGAIEDWPHHLGKFTAFWSSVMLTSGRYKGSPMAAHLKHRASIDPAMFERWLALWGETADAMLAAEDAAEIRMKAERIAESLKLGLFFTVGPALGRTAA